FALVLGAICGLLGGVRIFYNWQSGKDHHIDAQVMAWFLSCLFLSLLSASLKALYGIS
ncbi:MAG TPA: plasmid transfer protein, partial [Sphingobacterium sp.]|nr:plasmid transfer protein [Sphingobacterium sp.]